MLRIKKTHLTNQNIITMHEYHNQFLTYIAAYKDQKEVRISCTICSRVSFNSYEPEKCFGLGNIWAFRPSYPVKNTISSSRLATLENFKTCTYNYKRNLVLLVYALILQFTPPGVYDIYIDTAQQKLTVVGRAELDKILKAIKKTKKIATICSHTDPNAPPPAEPPAPEAVPNPPPAEAPPAKPEEPPKDPPPLPPPPPPPQESQAKPSEEAKEAAAPELPKVVDEVRMVHYYPYSYTSSRQHEAPSWYIYHWAPAPKYRYSWMEAYDEDYYHCRQRGDGNKMTVFSEENPNNCSIM